ncbi:MAG TPA: DNA-binding response regulator, partial [Acidobacteriaceae bacterium]|nr:DNA-binding response regulator [Acidobacteriaceae bacterium]
MNRIILADNQAIFRAGAARVLALEDDMRIVSQCDDAGRMSSALDAHQGAVLIFSSSMQADVHSVVTHARENG